MSSSPTPSQPWCGGTDLRKSYRGTVAALRGVTLRIDPAEYVALTGPSGSGKSTLLHILSGLLTPSGGERWMCGTRNPSARQRAALARTRVGTVFQSFHLLPHLSAVENVALSARYRQTRDSERMSAARDALGRVGLADRATHRPAELSGGEQQRVAIARALAMGREVLFADEPTGNLDSATGAEVLDVFDQLHADGMAIVLVTHSDEAAARAERRIRLRDGLIDSEGGS